MNEKNEDADVPLVGQEAEENEKNWKAVMKSVLEEISFWSDEDMSKETTKMFSKLSNVKYLHFEGNSRN